LILVIFAGIWKVKVLVQKNYSAKEIEGKCKRNKGEHSECINFLVKRE
jgi:hypothetical protein